MTIESVLYNIGAGLPIVLAFAAASGLGWFIRREGGVAACAGIMAGLLNFGAAIRNAGEPMTQQQSGIAAGAATVSAVAVFFALYTIGLQMRAEAEKHGRLVTAIGTLTLSVVGGCVSMAATLLLTKNPWLTSYTESLFTYSFILGGFAFALIKWQESKTASIGQESTKGDEGSEKIS